MQFMTQTFKQDKPAKISSKKKQQKNSSHLNFKVYPSWIFLKEELSVF